MPSNLAKCVVVAENGHFSPFKMPKMVIFSSFNTLREVGGHVRTPTKLFVYFSFISGYLATFGL